jgi:N-acetylglucosaminyldiphosphoundecaprenol N-acetyl-beta-D-mannosaminyltransferase
MSNLLGVRIDNITKNEALQQVSGFLDSSKQNMIFTPNSEILVAGHRDKYFLDVLNKSSLNICDGKGVQIFGKIKQRITGVDFMLDICGLAEKVGKSIYLLGSGSEKVINNTVQSLNRKFSSLKIVGFNSGPELRIKNHELKYENDENDKIIDDIIMNAPDILFVAFGHEKQEKWIYEHLPHLPSIKIAMGVGGAFDVISGKIKRAPKWMQNIGLEWFWRLIKEPKRFKRIFTATITFPILCLMKH